MLKKILTISLIIFLGTRINAQKITNYEHCNCTETVNYSDNNVVEGAYELISNNIVIEKGIYNDGVKDGIWIVNNVKGNLISKIEYSNGILNGEYKLFYFDGQPKLSAKFENNLPDGEWSYFSKKGKIIKHGNYEKGKAVGIWKVFKNNGKKIIAEYDFNNEKSIITNDNAKAKESYLPRDDESGEYIIIYYPDRDNLNNNKPIEGLFKSSIQFVDLFNVPLPLMNTYTTFEYKVNAEIINGVLKINNLNYFDKMSFKSSIPSFPFIAQTNSLKNLYKINHTDFLKKRVKDRIFETLMIMGPWLSNSNSQFEIQIPFVLNDIRK